jgi:hypothetical protein
LYYTKNTKKLESIYQQAFDLLKKLETEQEKKISNQATQPTIEK